MELTILERIKLLEVLPPQGDLLTLKIVRKLRESLSLNEAELKYVGVTLEYACPHTDVVKGEGEAPPTVEKCNNRGFFNEPPTCGKHDVEMLPTGQSRITIPNAMMGQVKEIHMGGKALEIASNALQRFVKDNEQLTEVHLNLYEKFFPPEDENKE